MSFEDYVYEMSLVSCENEGDPSSLPFFFSQREKKHGRAAASKGNERSMHEDRGRRPPGPLYMYTPSLSPVRKPHSRTHLVGANLVLWEKHQSKPNQGIFFILVSTTVVLVGIPIGCSTTE